MTARIPDRPSWDEERHSWMGELPLPDNHPSITPREDSSLMNAAC
jgi:hypothetical protein